MIARFNGTDGVNNPAPTTISPAPPAAVNGVLLSQFPDSAALMDLCRTGEAFHSELVTQGRTAYVLGGICRSAQRST